MEKKKPTMKCTYPDCNCPESGCQGFGEFKLKSFNMRPKEEIRTRIDQLTKEIDDCEYKIERTSGLRDRRSLEHQKDMAKAERKGLLWILNV